MPGFFKTFCRISENRLPEPKAKDLAAPQRANNPKSLETIRFLLATTSEKRLPEPKAKDLAAPQRANNPKSLETIRFQIATPSSWNLGSMLHRVQFMIRRFDRVHLNFLLHLLLPALSLSIPSFCEASPSSPKSFSIVTFNVENLFDTSHDPKKDDYTYLPKDLKVTSAHRHRCKNKSARYRAACLDLDWNESQVEGKLSNLASQIETAPTHPTIVLLTEVENLGMLRRLNQSLRVPYKKEILIEDNDPRGIDIGILTDLTPSTQPIIVPIYLDGTKKRLARGILQADLWFDHNIIRVLGVHLPAPYHPVEKRLAALRTLDSILNGTDPRTFTIAAGDFNISNKEANALFRGTLTQNWQVSHLEGCARCLGTYYFHKDQSWSFLDAILVAQKNTCRFVNKSIQTLHQNSRGSDHLPLYAMIEC